MASLTHGEIVWIDLSTFSVRKAKSFYRDVLGWGYRGSGYQQCFAGEQVCAGLFEMPRFFQKIKMPSFWMTYIAVDDIAPIVVLADRLGGKVELQETNELGDVALIRDPLGAGFTCYQGSQPSSRAEKPKFGQWYWSELFVSNAEEVKPFYAELFGWTYEKDEGTDGRWIARTAAGQRVTAIQEADESLRGDKEFWAGFFQVDSLESAQHNIKRVGGGTYCDLVNTEGTHAFVYDNQGAAFFLTPGANEPEGRMQSALKWRSFIGLGLVWAAVLLEANWVWGLLFLLWVLPDLKSGHTYFLEPVSRSRNPILFWSIMGSWILLSVLMFLPSA